LISKAVAVSKALSSTVALGGNTTEKLSQFVQQALKQP